jgi:hypothetical protein
MQKGEEKIPMIPCSISTYGFKTNLDFFTEKPYFFIDL